MPLNDSLFAKIGAHVGNDFDCPEDPRAVAEAFECSRRLFENLRCQVTDGTTLNFRMRRAFGSNFSTYPTPTSGSSFAMSGKPLTRLIRRTRQPR
jgi:hypothetical protein